MSAGEIIRQVFNRERITFLVVGCSSVIIDFIVYSLLYVAFDMPVFAAKGVGFVAGAGFSYWANRRFTFVSQKAHRKAAWPFIVLYSVTLGLNVVINGATIELLSSVPFVYLLAFVFATAVSTIVNYVGMKFVVFRQS